MRATAAEHQRRGTPAKSIDAYLAALPARTRAVLQQLRRGIKAAAPKAEETISYGMPAFKYKGPLVYFAAFKDHCSFFPGDKASVRAFRRKLAGFATSAGTIHFTVEKPLPAALVRRIVRMRVKQNDLRSELRCQRSGSR